MAQQRESSVNRRELGRIVRQAMARQNMSGKDLAEILGWSESKVSRVVSGHNLTTQEELSAMLALCRVTGDARAEAMSLITDGPRAYAFVDQERILRDNLHIANHVTEYGGSAVPPLLQTAGYMERVFSHCVAIAPGDIPKIANIRKYAWRTLETRELNCTFFMHEHALRVPVGDRRVMKEQREHLLRVSQSSRTALHIIPASAGAHAGITGGPWTLLELETAPTAVRELQPTGARFIESDECVRIYEKSAGALSAVSLDVTASRALLSAITSETIAVDDNQ